MGSDRPRRRARRWQGLAFAVAALVGGAAAEPRAATAGTAYVRSEAQFSQAVARFSSTGGTIVLRGGRYESLAIGPRGSARLTVRATRNASIGRLNLAYTRSVTVVGLRFTPRYGRAGIDIVRSRNIRLERIVVSGGSTGLKANVILRLATGVTIEKSRFSRCGDKAVCILTGWSSGVRVLRSRFHDCYGCDFIRGNFGRTLVIRQNRFDRAMVGPCGKDLKRCNHQEMIELHTGKRLFIERNRFGVYQPPGAGQVALFGSVNDVRIRNNLFLRTDPKVPGLVARVGVNLGGYGVNPKRVQIVHNTILAGRPHWRGFANSVRIKPSLAYMSLADRPVIANNVILLMRTPRFFCRGARLTVGNVIENGETCNSRDVLAPVHLNAAGQPTASSTNVVDSGIRRWSTVLDLRGARRDERPDRGAFEYVAPAGG